MSSNAADIIASIDDRSRVAVLSRFKETDDRWHELLDTTYGRVIVYNKFEGENLLPNLGRESHTYLTYIVNNYNNLPDEILFSQYAPWDHFDNKTTFGITGDPHVRWFMDSYLYDFIGIRPIDYDCYVRGRRINWIGYAQELYGRQDFDFVNKMVSTGSALNGVFRVTREAILKNPVELYKKGIEMLERGIHTNEGYFFERMWKPLFTDYGKCDKYPWIADSIFLFGNDLPGGKGKSRKSGAYGHIKFFNDGTICNNSVSFYHHANESFWTMDGDILIVLNTFGGVTSTYNLKNYNRDDRQAIIFGDCYLEKNNIKHNFFWLKSPMWN